MKRKLGSTLVLAVVLTGSAAFAQIEVNMPDTGPAGGDESGISGFELGVRSSYGVPLGNAGDGAKFSELVKGMIPFWIDVGYRVDSNWYVGAFYQYGLGFVPTNISSQGCNVTGVSCSVSSHRIGANVHYHFLADQKLDPWLGVGAAYEIMTLGVSGGGASARLTSNGFEFGNAQLGLDYKASPMFGLGPFVTFTVAQFSGRSASLNGQDLPIGDYANKAIHMWLICGLRGTFDVRVD